MPKAKRMNLIRERSFRAKMTIFFPDNRKYITNSIKNQQLNNHFSFKHFHLDN